MAIWMNSTAMQLVTMRHRLTRTTLKEGDVMNRHIDLQRARVGVAPINEESSSIGVSSASKSRFRTEVKCEGIKSEWRNPKNVTAVILGGGAGTRLMPLTQRRAKPAVPVGGAYRLIDVPISNCLNSQIKKVYIMTQFNSRSLNRYITTTYNVSANTAFADGFIEVLAATQFPGEGGSNWFQGTADAVRQFAWLFEDARANKIDDVLILSGDHLYQMDYMEFLQSHRKSRADVTISCVPMDSSRASDFGLMKIDRSGRIVSFSEKPKGDTLKSMEVDTTVLGLSRKEAEKKRYIASMGIYAFKKDVLLDLLRNQFPGANDFGSEIIPLASREFLVKAYLFNGYWEDIGTIRSFYEANLALTDKKPRFNFYDEDRPMFTSRTSLPPSMINASKVKDAIISHGCILDNCSVQRSVLGVQSHISPNAEMKDTVMFGADYRESEEQRLTLISHGKVPLGVGPNTYVSNCILDKNVRIGRNVRIFNRQGVVEADRSSDGYYIRDGIVVIMKDVTIREGRTI